MYVIEMVNRKSGEVVRRIEESTYRVADRISRQLFTQMDKNKYFIRITGE